jgi:TetR/AcrR family transcriptional regulator, cholesterol catabolism regulator
MSPGAVHGSLRERKKAVTRERICFQAMLLFRRKGYSAATVDEIAEAAQVSKGTFFNYFSGKDALLEVIGQRQAAGVAAELQKRIHQRPLPARLALSRLLACLADHLESNRELARIILFESPRLAGWPGGDPYRRLLQETAAQLLAKGQARAEIRPSINAAVAASAVTGLAMEQICSRLASEPGRSLAEQFEAGLDLLWSGLEPD